jgi:hypothetical protein
MSHTQRDFLKITGGIAAAAPFCDRLHAQVEIKPEAGAKLRVLRWKRFVQGDEDAWLAHTRKFNEQTGIEVRVDSENWEDIRPKAAVAANIGSGPDIILSTNDDSHQYPDKLLDVSDVCEYTPFKFSCRNMMPNGYAGKLGTASAACMADFIVVNMVAEAATGQATVAEAMRKGRAPHKALL